MHYYHLSIKEEKVLTLALPPEYSPVSHKLSSEIKDFKRAPFSLELHDVYVATRLIVGDELSNLFHDCQPNRMAWPLFSNRIKIIIASFLTGKEKLEWKEILVIGKSETRVYYIPFFTEKLDTLKEDRCVYFPGTTDLIVKHCFDKENVKNYSVFHDHRLDWQVPLGFYVSEEIKKALKESGIKDLEFEKVWIA